MIKTLTVREATERLRALGMKITVDTMYSGLQQGVFPFGQHIETKNGNPVYLVYEKLFKQWIEERDV